MKIEPENIPDPPERKPAVPPADGERRFSPGASSLMQEVSCFAAAVAALRAGGIAQADRLRVSTEVASRFEAILATPATDADELGIKIRLSLGEGAHGLEAPRGTADGLIADVHRLMDGARLTAAQPSE